jgi:VPDSG-CTERM exosortase interaction domain
MKLPKLLPILITLVLPSLSWASITFTLGNNPQPGEENILLNSGETGGLVHGTTNQSGLTVIFASETQVLSEPSSGQARIEATNNGSQVGLSDLSISLANGGTFTDAIFNPFIGGTVGTPGGTATIIVDTDITSTFSYTLGNGQNFLTIVATGGEVISDIIISYPTGFTDLRQPRISGATIPTVPDGGATLPLLGAGVLSLALLRRKLAS